VQQDFFWFFSKKIGLLLLIVNFCETDFWGVFLEPAQVPWLLSVTF
jgi:hypothetical protein